LPPNKGVIESGGSESAPPPQPALLHGFGSINIAVAKQRFQEEIDFIRNSVQQYQRWCTKEDEVVVSRFLNFRKDNVSLNQRLSDLKSSLSKCTSMAAQYTEETLPTAREPRDLARIAINQLQRIAAATNYDCYVHESEQLMLHTGAEGESPLRLTPHTPTHTPTPHREGSSTPYGDPNQLATISLCTKSFLIDVIVGIQGQVSAAKLTYTSADAKTIEDDRSNKLLTDMLRWGRFDEFERLLTNLSASEALDRKYSEAKLMFCMYQLERDIEEVTDRETQSLILAGTEAAVIQLEQLRTGHGLVRKHVHCLELSYYLSTPTIVTLTNSGIRDLTDIKGFSVFLKLEETSQPMSVRLPITTQVTPEPMMMTSLPTSSSLLSYPPFSSFPESSDSTRPVTPVTFSLEFKPPIHLVVPVVHQLLSVLSGNQKIDLATSDHLHRSQPTSLRAKKPAANPISFTPQMLALLQNWAVESIVQLVQQNTQQPNVKEDSLGKSDEALKEVRAEVFGERHLYRENSPPVQMRTIAVKRIPFTHPSHVLPALNAARQQLAYAELYDSCFGQSAHIGDDEEMPDVTVEVTCEQPRLIALLLLHPTSSNLMAVNIEVPSGSFPSVTIQTVEGDPVPCSDEYATRELRTCMSIPITISNILKRGKGVLQ